MLKLLRHTLFATLVLCTTVYHTGLAMAASTLDKIQQRGELILGTSGNMPSMTQVDESGKVTGFDIDMARFMAQSMDVSLVTRVMPFNKLLSALEEGKVDVVISNVTITQKRNLNVAFVGPYLTSGKCFVTKDSSLAQPDQSPTLDITDTRLVVLEGSTSEDIVRQLYPQATVVTVENFSAGADMVKRDEASGMLTDYPICTATLRDNPDAGFVSLFSLLTYEPIGIALPSGDAQFINWTQNFLRRLEGTGTLEGLSKAWFGEIKSN